MAQTIRDVMTTNPRTVSADSRAVEAARAMRDDDIGAVVVLEGDQVAGLLTDRDIVIRAVAEGRDPSTVEVGEIASRDLTTLSPDDDVESAVQLMRDRAVRRLPVVDGGKPVGIVSLGDLAIERDPGSALADISAARPNE